MCCVLNVCIFIGQLLCEVKQMRKPLKSFRAKDYRERIRQVGLDVFILVKVCNCVLQNVTEDSEIAHGP